MLPIVALLATIAYSDEGGFPNSRLQPGGIDVGVSNFNDFGHFALGLDGGYSGSHRIYLGGQIILEKNCI